MRSLFAIPILLAPCGWSFLGKAKDAAPGIRLSTEEAFTEQQAWNIVFADARRWDIEGTWRFSKSELGFECPRVRNAEGCRKLLMMAAPLVCLPLDLDERRAAACAHLALEAVLPSRGTKARIAHLPLYRVRLALSRLWQRSPPRFELLAMRRLA